VNLVLILYDISNIAELFLNIGYGVNVKDTKRQHRIKKENMTSGGYQQIQEKYVKINMSGDCSYKYPIL